MWEAMSINWPNTSRLAACGPVIHDAINAIDYTTCLLNVATFINNNAPYDFVGLQEATNWRNIRLISTTLKNMEYINYKSGQAQIVTFYDKKYTLELDTPYIRSYMADTGRPFIILFFAQKICLINLHAGHGQDINKFDQYVIRALNSLPYQMVAPQMVQKLKTYNIIMMGDFNDNLTSQGGNDYSILTDPYFAMPGGRKLYGINKKNTCCDNTLTNSSSVFTPFDHILSTSNDTNSYVQLIKQASDHMPIISTVQFDAALTPKNIAYDFDGVLHKTVGLPDASGQRHPLPGGFFGPFDPFNAIIDQIDSDLNKGNRVFIITARSDNNLNRQTITKFLLGTKLAPKEAQIQRRFTSGEDKVAVLANLKIDTFYDDSCLRIVEVYNAMQNDLLPDLTELYLVVPDNDTWTLIDSSNVSTLCSAQAGSILTALPTVSPKTIIPLSTITAAQAALQTVPSPKTIIPIPSTVPTSIPQIIPTVSTTSTTTTIPQIIPTISTTSTTTTIPQIIPTISTTSTTTTIPQIIPTISTTSTTTTIPQIIPTVSTTSIKPATGTFATTIPSTSSITTTMPSIPSPKKIIPIPTASTKPVIVPTTIPITSTVPTTIPITSTVPITIPITSTVPITIPITSTVPTTIPITSAVSTIASIPNISSTIPAATQSIPQDVLLIRLNDIMKNTQPTQTANIDQASQIIEQLVRKYNFVLKNPAIQKLLQDLNNIIDDVTKNQRYTEPYLRYINKLQYDIATLVTNELNANVQPVAQYQSVSQPIIRPVSQTQSIAQPQTQTSRDRQIVQLETGMMNLINQYLNIIKKNPNLNYTFTTLLATNKLEPADVEMIKMYKNMGVRDDIASLITIFYSVLQKMKALNIFVY